MNLPVSAQIAGLSEPLFTDCALEWFLASVTPHVDLQST